MARDRYFDDATVTIEHTALDGTLAPLAGLTDLVVSIRRLSDGQFLDWNDDTFKAAGWTMRQQVMSEVDSTNAPGDYAQDFDLSAVTNKAADDTYVARVEQTPGTSVANVPASGEFEEGLNDPSPADIDTELSSSHGAGDWDLSQADVQAAMTAQGYTAARGALLDNLDTTVSSVFDSLLIVRALLQENAVVDDQVHNAFAKLTEAYLYCYDSKVNADLHDKATGLVASFLLEGTYTGADQDTWKVTRLP